MSKEYPELNDIEIELRYPYAGSRKLRPFLLISFDALLRIVKLWDKVEIEDAYGLLTSIYEHAIGAGRSSQEDMAVWADSIDRQPIGETMPVEMYVGRVESQDWYTVEVDIPANTPDNKIEVVATAELIKILAKEQVYAAFHGVYHVPSPDEGEPNGGCGSPTE